jgi:hypothetical protein
MPIAGFVRLRKHQFARQAVFGTNVAATRAYPFGGTPSVELNWTDPEVDVGSRDPVAAPYRVAPDLTASLTDAALAYNNLPLMLCGFFGGGVSPTGGPDYSWVYEPASLTVDDPDVFVYEFGDDVLTDWFQLGDGMLESLEFTGPDGLGPLTASMTWRFGSVASSGSTDSPDNPAVPTAGLNVSTTDAICYLKDGKIAIADTVAGLAAGQISDALHTFTLRLSQEIDVKRFANGTQSFDAQAYGPGARQIELECTWAKTSDIVGISSESDWWMSDAAVNRYVQLTFTSTVMADGATPYSWVITMPMRYYTRTEGEIGGNTTVILTGHAFYDPDDLDGVFTSTVVNTLAEATLGSTPGS